MVEGLPIDDVRWRGIDGRSGLGAEVAFEVGDVDGGVVFHMWGEGEGVRYGGGCCNDLVGSEPHGAELADGACSVGGWI